MKNLTIIVSALLLAVVFAAPAKAVRFESFADSNTSSFVNSCRVYHGPLTHPSIVDLFYRDRDWYSVISRDGC